jgi:hypothetical protein
VVRYSLLAGVVVTLVLMAAGCNAIGGRAGEDRAVHTLYAGSQCGVGEEVAHVRWIDHAEGLAAFLGRLQGFAPAEAPEVDWDRRALVLVAMGQRPSAGFSLGLAQESARVLDGALELRVDWLKPPAGTRQAQVITSPCLLLSVPRGGYGRVRVVDRERRVRASATVQ